MPETHAAGAHHGSHPTIAPADSADVGELWTVQRAAYVDEAQTYGDAFVVALTESQEQLATAVEGPAVLLTARLSDRLVGGARGRTMENVGVVSRLFVAPDQRRRGVGRALLSELEQRLLAHDPQLRHFVLSIGHGGQAAQALARRAGYRETHRDTMLEHVTMVHLRKDAADAVP